MGVRGLRAQKVRRDMGEKPRDGPLPPVQQQRDLVLQRRREVGREKLEAASSAAAHCTGGSLAFFLVWVGG